MRKLIARLLVVVGALTVAPLWSWGAGDASAIRRATRPEDSRYMSNYRPSSRAASYSYRARATNAAASTAKSSRGTVGCRGR